MRQAVKFWARRRASAMWVIGSLGVAIGVATAAWSIGFAVWLRPLPFPDADRLVSVQSDRAVTLIEYGDWRHRQDVFTDLAGLATISGGLDNYWFLERSQGLIPLTAVHVTANFFDVLGVTPIRGRRLTAADDEPGAPSVAIISDDLWQSAFGGAPDVIGQQVAISVINNGTHRAEIVGVLPRRVNVPIGIKDVNFFATIPEEWRGPKPPETRWGYGTSHTGNVSVFARLRPNVAISAAAARMTEIQRAIDLEFPRPTRFADASGNSIKVGPRPTRTAVVLPLHEFWYGSARPMLLPLAAVSLLVVVVAVTNALGVLLALTARRSREFAVRSALGSSSGQLRTMILMELIPLAIGAAGLAVITARWLVGAVAMIAPAGIPHLVALRVDWRATLVGLGLTIAAVGASGAVLALMQGRRRLLLPALQGGGASTGTVRALRSRRVLMAAQISIVLALLTAAGLVTSSLWRLLAQPLGFDLDHVLSVDVIATRSDVQETKGWMQFFDDLRREVQAAPGRRDVAVTVEPPLAASGVGGMRVTFLDGTYRSTFNTSVSEGYFRVMGIPMIAGRDFAPTDRASCPIITNAAFARTYFGGAQQAIENELILGGGRCHIIGVVGDVRDGPIAEPVRPTIYPLLVTTLTRQHNYLVTREQGSLDDAARQIREAVRRVDPTAFVIIDPLANRQRAQTTTARLGMMALGGLAGFTLLLACLGIAATVAQVSAERQRELAIRSALGASGHSLVLLMMRIAAIPTVGGLALGLLISSWIAPLVGRLLFNTSPFDAVIWSLGAGVLFTAVTSASWIPARRAGGIDPAMVLRQE